MHVSCNILLSCGTSCFSLPLMFNSFLCRFLKSIGTKSRRTCRTINGFLVSGPHPLNPLLFVFGTSLEGYEFSSSLTKVIALQAVHPAPACEDGSTCPSFHRLAFSWQKERDVQQNSIYLKAMEGFDWTEFSTL